MILPLILYYCYVSVLIVKRRLATIVHFVLFPRRAALEKWKQRLGSKATYNKLIGVFECAGYQGYADTVRQICGRSQLLQQLL